MLIHHSRLCSAARPTSLSAEALRPYQMRESLEQLVADIGPCPGDIQGYIRQPRKYLSNIDDALSIVGDIDSIFQLFRNAVDDMAPSSESLVLLRRELRAGQRRDYPDSSVVIFKTRRISLKLMERLAYLRSDDAKSISRAVKFNHTGVLARWNFQAMAIGYTSGNNLQIQPAGFHRMDRIKGTQKHSHRFLHSLDESEERCAVMFSMQSPSAQEWSRQNDHCCRRL